MDHTESPTVSVVVPWSPTTGCQHRERAYAWVLARLAAVHPDWEVVEGLGGDPWCKAAAVEDGLSRATGDVIIVHDADVLVSNLAEAVDAVDAGAPWSMPHGDVHRFTEAATDRIINGDDPAAIVAESSVLTEPAYHGWEGGGVVVLRRADYWRAPMDHRFRKWGLEDSSWAHALDTILGQRVRLNAPLWHLWHPPASRLSRIVGSKESERLWHEYRKVRGDPDRMAALIAEGRPDARPSRTELACPAETDAQPRDGG